MSISDHFSENPSSSHSFRISFYFLSIICIVQAMVHQSFSRLWCVALELVLESRKSICTVTILKINYMQLPFGLVYRIGIWLTMFTMDWQINQGIILALQSFVHRCMKVVLLKKWRRFCLHLLVYRIN